MHLKWHGRLICTDSPYRFLASTSVQSNRDEYVEYHLKQLKMVLGYWERLILLFFAFFALSLVHLLWGAGLI